MALPCNKCGAEKTEDVRRGLLYSLAKALGYRLRRCSRCHRLRLLPRRDKRPIGSVDDRPAPLPKAAGACPHCGKMDYYRSRRTVWERLILRGPMARCRACSARFSMPRPIDLET